MSVQKTDRVLKCYRIGDPDGAFPIYDAEGARLYPGRWNTHTSPIVYTSEHYSTALLEKLVHANLVMPANQHFIEITIPNGVSYEIFQTAAHPGWDSRNETICKAFAQEWHEKKRSALLNVPSIPARLERNYLINPAHPDAKGIAHTLPEPVWWEADRAEATIAGGGSISVQVLNELANVSRRKMQMSWDDTHAFLNMLRGPLTIHPITVETHETGLRIAERYGLSISDSMIAASALDAGCNTLWSEHMQHGMKLDEGLRIANPFRGA